MPQKVICRSENVSQLLITADRGSGNVVSVRRNLMNTDDVQADLVSNVACDSETLFKVGQA